MAKRRFRANLFDVFILIIILILACLLIFGWNNKPYLGSKKVIVSVRTVDSQSIENILPIVEKSNDKQVFYSGTKYPVIQKSYYTSAINGNISSLTITLEGLGDIADNNSIFNGQRIYNNQKVEIRSDYFLQAFVTDFRYEN